MPDKGWQRRFDEPIPLQKGKKLVTLRDAAEYITKLPKAEHDAEEWLAVMKALLLVAESDGPTMFARIGVMRALNRRVERVFKPSRKAKHWGRRKLGKGAMKAGREIIAAPSRTDWNIGGLWSLLRMARDRWVEVLRCPDCRRTGKARLWAEDGYSWEFQVDNLPAGFKVCEPMMDGTFYCISCGIPAEP
jgi:hypothetical protein